MALDWRALAPHRPLSVEEASAAEMYAPRPESPSEEVLRWLDASGGRPLALFGPTGCGKSTELAAVARALTTNGSTITILVQLDREITVRPETTVAALAHAIVRRCVRTAEETFHVALSDELRSTVKQLDAGSVRLPAHTGFDLLRMAVSEIGNTKKRELVLLVDGLEKLPIALQRELVREIVTLSEDARVVLVVSVELATGPEAVTLVNDYRLIGVGPVVVDHAIDPTRAADGMQFLVSIGARRLGVFSEGPGSLAGLLPALTMAANQSGGVPRTFLQLLQDGGARASMRGPGFPTREDVLAAANDQAEQVFRLLRDGDVLAIRAATGHTSTEVELERRLRLLAHGILLEYRTAQGPRVYPLPLLAPRLARKAA